MLPKSALLTKYEEKSLKSTFLLTPRSIVRTEDATTNCNGEKSHNVNLPVLKEAIINPVPSHGIFDLESLNRRENRSSLNKLEADCVITYCPHQKTTDTTVKPYF